MAEATLRGPNAGTPGQDSARGEEATITAPSGQRAIDLKADQAEVNGLRVEGSKGNGGSVIKATQSGLGNEVTVKNSVIRASDDASGFDNGIEVVSGSSKDAPVNALIEDNDINIDTGTAGAAVNVLKGGSNNNRAVTVRNNRLGGDIGGYRQIDDLTIENNEILPAGTTDDTALDVEVSASNATISNNTFSGNAGDVALDDDEGSLNRDTLINNNTFEPGAEKATADRSRTDEDGDNVIKFSN
jgi:hypothetical protein